MNFISSLLNKVGFKSPCLSPNTASNMCHQTQDHIQVSRNTASIAPSSPSFDSSTFSDDNTPAWTLLDADFHLQTLNLNSVNAGLLEMIPDAPRNILDVGCFCGGNGRWLKARFPHCHITGIEFLEKAAAIASKDYDRVIPKRFEDVSFESDKLGPGNFDAIIAADVLEHLYNPWQALLRLKPLVSSSGALYASIPNVRNLRVIQPLAKGRWPYDKAGLKDVTHLRFFTHKEVTKMFEETGWKIKALEYHLDGGLMKLVEDKDLSTINSFVMDGITLTDLTRDDVMELLAMHFFVKAVPVRQQT